MIPPKKTSACVFVPRVGSRSSSPSFPVFYLFINHRLSQREKKGQDILVVSSQIGTALLFLSLFFSPSFQLRFIL
jgi:hypothetical protein